METNAFAPEPQPKRHPSIISGLGGWLVLVQIGLYGTLLLQVVQLFRYTVPALLPEMWGAVTSPQSELYDPLWAPTLLFELAVNVSLPLFCLYTLVCMYRKLARVPRLMIVFYSANALFAIVDYALLNLNPMARELVDDNSVKDIVRSIFACAIWIPYFVRSIRVKNTFVN